MKQTSLACFVAAAIAAGGAFAQNAPAPTGTGATPSQQSAPPRSTTQSQTTAQPAGAAQSPGSGQSSDGTSSRAQPQQPRTPQSQKRAETQADTFQSPSPRQSKTETRPDANYPHPSGQDSHPDHAPRDTKIAAAGSKAATQSGQEKSPKGTGRSQQVDRLAKKKDYTGAAGAKGDPGTACSTARPTTDGGVDCGTSGNSATADGRVITKPH